MMTREDVDPDNVAAVGVCIGGGYAVSAAARERKIKTVVSIAGGFNVGGTFQQFMGIEGFAAYSAKINAVMREQDRTGKSSMSQPSPRDFPRLFLWLQCQTRRRIPTTAVPTNRMHRHGRRR